MLVIVPCGQAKRATRSQAGVMYTGTYHRACLDYARSIAPAEAILILSAKYGLLRLTDWVEPYDLRMGQRGAVTPDVVRAQAIRLGVLDARPVIALGGVDYTGVCRAVWPGCVLPLSGVGGLGRQLQWLRQHRGRLPDGVPGGVNG